MCLYVRKNAYVLALYLRGAIYMRMPTCVGLRRQSSKRTHEWSLLQFCRSTQNCAKPLNALWNFETLKLWDFETWNSEHLKLRKCVHLKPWSFGMLKLGSSDNRHFDDLRTLKFWTLFFHLKEFLHPSSFQLPPLHQPLSCETRGGLGATSGRDVYYWKIE